MVPQRLPKDLEQRLFDLTLALYRVTDFFPPGEVLRKHLREKANEIFSQVLEYNYVEDPENATLKILGKIQSFKGYLGIAKSLRVVRPINLTILEREYIFLADFFTGELESLNQTDKPIETVNTTVDLEIKPGSEISAGLVKPPEAIAEILLPGKEEKVAEKEKESLPSWREFSKGDANSVLLLNERQEAILEHLKQTQQASPGVDRPRAKVSDFYSFFSNISSKTVQRDLQGLVAKNLLKKEGEKRWTVYTLNFKQS